MTAVMDWDRFAASYWNREPAVVPCPSPVPLQRAYAAIVTASEPFRQGTRFFTLPDVRFFTTYGRVRAPGDLLPGAADATAADYLNRSEVCSGGDGCLLVVEEPLMLDFGLWSGVRDLISGLWRQVGWPNLPMAAELAIGSTFTRNEGLTTPSRHATMIWVLNGDMSVRLWPEERTLEGGTGQLLYVPAAHRFTLVYGNRCVALCLRVPVDGSLAVAAVRAAVTDVVQSRRDSGGAVPFLGPPSRPSPASAGEVLPVLAAIGDEVRHVLDGPELDRILRIKWAACRSAAALEPAPPPRGTDALAGDQRIRLASEVMRLPDGPDGWVWAVNGHAFAVRGADSERVLAHLSENPCVEVSRLCRTADGEPGGSALALVRRLYSLRAVDPVPDGR